MEIGAAAGREFFERLEIGGVFSRGCLLLKAALYVDSLIFVLSPSEGNASYIGVFDVHRTWGLVYGRLRCVGIQPGC